jgi:hypothetical protein
LTFAAPVIGGTQAAEFSLVAPATTTLAPGQITTFGIRFQALTGGLKTIDVTISNNDLTKSTYAFGVHAAGIGHPEIVAAGKGLNISDDAQVATLANGTDFGLADVGTGAITNTFAFTNIGTTNLTLSLPRITGPAAGDYTLGTPSATSLAPNANTIFTVVFRPTGTGARAAEIFIDNNDADENPFNFAILGHGVGHPEITLFGNGLHIPDDDTTPDAADGTDFGSVNTAEGSVTNFFTVTNIGTTNLTLSSPVISGAAAADFFLVGTVAADLTPGAFTQFGIAFDPSSDGLRTAEASLGNSDPNRTPYNFALRGTGTTPVPNTPEIDVTGLGLNIVSGDLSPSPADGTDFGTLDVTTGATTNFFTITNSGSADATVSTPSITGPAASDFILVSQPGSLIPTAGSTTFAVRFAPSAPGTRDATIAFANNDADENPFSFALRGFGVGSPEIGILGNGILIPLADNTPRVADGTDFGSQNTFNGSVTRFFAITNSGSSHLSISTPNISGPNAGDFTLLLSPVSDLSPTGSSSFGIRFNPSADGVRSAIISVSSSDTGKSPYTFSVQGTGTAPPPDAPEIALLGSGLAIAPGETSPSLAKGTDFGAHNVAAGATTNHFTITNSGTASLTISVPTITGPAASDYSLVIAPASAIPAGGSSVFAIRFAPASAGTRAATVSISNDDSDENPYTFDIVGQGSLTPATGDFIATYLKPEYLAAGNYGHSVAADADTLVVGVPLDAGTMNTAPSRGIAYVYIRSGTNWTLQAQLTAPSGSTNDQFGTSVAISGDTIVVGAPGEDSGATGIGGDQNDEGAPYSGAAYVYFRTANAWSLQAYVKAHNTGSGDDFGNSVAIDGDQIVIGASSEDSGSKGINQGGERDDAANAGAAYVFRRTGSVWTQQAYLKAENTDAGDLFGVSVDISGDRVAIGASGERAITGINGNAADNSGFAVGAVYVFERSAVSPNQWSQQAYLKAPNGESLDHFGQALSLDGGTLAVASPFEDSNATGVNGDGTNNEKTRSGAVYLFERDGSGQWMSQSYLKASVTDAEEAFGFALHLSGDRLVVGAPFEDSQSRGIGGNPNDNTANQSGAAYVFERIGGVWSQTRYVKALNTDELDAFGSSVAITPDYLVIGAPSEGSAATGINGNTSDNSAPSAGAVYCYLALPADFGLSSYAKASVASSGANFGESLAVSDASSVVGAPLFDSAYVFLKSESDLTEQARLLPGTSAKQRFGAAVAISADTVVVGAPHSGSLASGIDGSETDTSGVRVGAAYVYVRNGTAWTRQAYLKASNPDSQDLFGTSVAIHGDTIVIGAPGESSQGNEANNGSTGAGAAYVFVRNGGTWTQQAYLKAANTEPNASFGPDAFGSSVSVFQDTIAIGAPGEDGAGTDVSGDPSDNALSNAGSVYIFRRTGSAWEQESYLKEAQPTSNGAFGAATSLHENTLAIGSNGDRPVSIFVRANQQWELQASFRGDNTESGDLFGSALALNGDRLIAGARGESSRSRMSNRHPEDNSYGGAGAAYVFQRLGTTWRQVHYLKALNTDAADGFGWAVGISPNGALVGAPMEDSHSTSPISNSALSSGSVYIYGGGPSLPLLANETLAIRATSTHSASHTLVLPDLPGATYQWYFAAFPSGNPIPIAGATGSTYVTGLAERNRTGYYFALVTTQNGQFLTTPTFLDVVKPQEILQILPIQGGIRLYFDDVNSPGRPLDLNRVEVQWRASMPRGTDTNWNVVTAGSISATSETVRFDDPTIGSTPIRFYRIVEH